MSVRIGRNGGEERYLTCFDKGGGVDVILHSKSGVTRLMEEGEIIEAI